MVTTWTFALLGFRFGGDHGLDGCEVQIAANAQAQLREARYSEGIAMNTPLSRRTFLSGSGSLLAARTVLLAPQGLGAASGPAPASDRVRFGMIGIGMQGSGLLGTAITLPGVECVAAADLYDGRHTLAREITGNPTLPTTRRYQELLDRKDIDCIVAAVPDHWHKRVVVDACNAGKDIYCEKPMSHAAAQGFDMAEAAQKNSRIVQIGSQRVSSVLWLGSCTNPALLA